VKKGTERTFDGMSESFQQAEIRKVLESLDTERIYKSRSAFRRDLNAALKRADVGLPPGVTKAIQNALSERDEDAEICLDATDSPEPDPDLRDTESVPLTGDVRAYFEREVLPHVADAWIDESKTKVGYEIPFTRHFYAYKPLRPLREIEGEIRALEEEIQGMLGEVLA
jgi:type I restriction enzyme M protein